jgi:YegS/Rv2252/BmrU family lipid kinase
MENDISRILVIINPASGRARSARNVEIFVDELHNLGATTHSKHTRGIAHARDIAACEGADYDLVVACGGDGTLSEVVSGLLELNVPPSVGFYPSGSTCDVARSFQLTTDPKEAARDMLFGRSFPIDIGMISRDAPSEHHDDDHSADFAKLPRHFTYVAAFGAFTEVSYATRRSLKKTFGHMAYVLTGMRSLRHIHSASTLVTLDDKDYSGDYLFGGLINSRSIGGLVPLPNAVLDDGYFDAVLVTKPKSFRLLWRLVRRLLQGKEDPHILRVPVRKALFQFDDPVPFTVDGEYGGTKSTWAIENLPRAITLRIAATEE